MLDFISTTDLEDFMGRAIDAGRAAFAVGVGQQVVRNYMQQEITYHTDDVEYHDIAWPSTRVRLRQRPVREVTSVKVDGVELDVSAWKLRKSILRLTSPVFPSDGEIVITYTHGWDDPLVSSDDEDTVPEDIRRVALAVARRSLIGEGSGDETSVQSETIGSYSYTLSAKSVVGADLNDSEESTLDWYVARLQI